MKTNKKGQIIETEIIIPIHEVDKDVFDKIINDLEEAEIKFSVRDRR